MNHTRPNYGHIYYPYMELFGLLKRYVDSSNVHVVKNVTDTNVTRRNLLN
jgi:hypothetical protein